MKTRQLLSTLVVLTLSCGVAAAADPTRPPETVALRPSALPGYAVAAQKCAICHSADYVAYQPPSMTQAQWTAEMTKMQHAYGAPISDDEVRQLGAYLAVAYGSAKATDPEIVAASRAPASIAVAASDTPPSKPAADAATLLTANGCLACHAVDRAIVGPAFHDVAMRYKNDDQALAKVSRSIKEGGSGRWGTVPMPPFAGLSEAEVHSLADDVLGR